MIYTVEQWKQDKTFQAQPGQPISADLYSEMLNALPPETALHEYDIPIHTGFLIGEPHSCDRSGRLLYLAFGMNDTGKGPNYYYILLYRPVTSSRTASRPVLLF